VDLFSEGQAEGLREVRAGEAVPVCAGEEELTLAEQLAEARQEALTDPVTGLPNRRAFDRAIAIRIEELRRYEAGFGLLVLDLDHFKRLNLRLGHAGADRVLQRFAEVAAGCVRAGNLLARWGGDEFAMIVERAAEDDLFDVADRLRLAVAQAGIAVDGRRVILHISVGGALAQADDTTDTLFARADRATYAAKAAGRNRAILGNLR
jgi:diguanylate cyclase (GGDEF)-like protein